MSGAAAAAAPVAALVEARGVVRRFGATTALGGVDLAVLPGELLGLVGPDGAGKSTLLRALAGLIDVDGGVASVLGVSWATAPAEARELLGYMPQQYSLYTDLSVDENLRFFADLFGLPRRVFAERRERLLGITRLERAADRPAGALSGGMYKKLAVACALLHRPRVLLLDEPTNGVDPPSRRELWALLYEFVGEGMGVLVATPYMDEAARCGRVALLHDGHVLTGGDPAQLLAGFPHAVLEVTLPPAVGGDAGDDRDGRAAVDELLERDRGVLALTPAGTRVRAVVRRDDEPRITAALAKLGAQSSRSRADFEDLYLALLADREAGPARPQASA